MKKPADRKASKWGILWGFLLSLLLTGCYGAKSSKKIFNSDLARQLLDAALARSVTDGNGQYYRNAVIRIEAPDYYFTYTGAAGIARADTGETMTVDHQFTIASAGKTMTAVIILQLWEAGALGEKGLDATLGDLSVFPPEVLDALHKINGVSYGREITVRQLLNQTSGLKDVLMDDENGIGDDYPEEYRGYAPGSLNGMTVFDEQKGFERMMDCIQNDMPAGCNRSDYYLSYTWPHWDEKAWVADPSNKMAGLLNFYLGGMNETALWKPGKAFHYADTNYILLGLVIEKLTGNSLHQELRTRIFDPLGMDHTYLAYSTNPPTKPWEGRLSDHWGSNTPLISNGINLSMDWGAGGEISTVQDLSVFIQALADGKLFKERAALEEMLRLPEAIEQPFYAAGIIAWPTDNGWILHHNGAPGSWIEYHTAHHLSIVGTVNDLDGADRFMTLRGDIYSALAEAGLRSANFKTGSVSMSLLETLGGEPPIVLLTALLGSLLIFLSALVVWPIAAIRRQHGSERRMLPSSAACWLSICMILVNLIFLVVFVFTIMRNPVQLLFGFNSFTLSILLLPLLSIVLTAGLIVFSILAWKESFWGIARRIHYSFTTLAAICYVWILAELHLLMLP